MPLTLDYADETLQKYQDKDRADGFATLPLTKAQKETVIYHKLEAASDKRSDTQHDPRHPWHECFTALPPRVSAAMQRNPDFPGTVHVGDELLSEDHGIICHWHGTPIKAFKGEATPGGYVFVERNGNIMTPTEANVQAESGGRMPAKCRMWAFRLDRAIWTDGPARNARLQETAEQQRAHAEENMATSMSRAFEAFAQKMMLPGARQPETVAEVDMADPKVLGAAIREALDAKTILPEQVQAIAISAEDPKGK